MKQNFVKTTVQENDAYTPSLRLLDGTTLNVEYFSMREKAIRPTHPMVKNWMFRDDTKEQEYNMKEAHLADAMARIAEANGMDANDLQHLFPAILRMLKSDSNWTR